MPSPPSRPHTHPLGQLDGRPLYVYNGQLREQLSCLALAS